MSHMGPPGDKRSNSRTTLGKEIFYLSDSVLLD